MTAAGEPLRLYPTRRQKTPLRPMPEYVAAKETERQIADLFRAARNKQHELRKALDDVARLDRHGYLDVGVDLLVTCHSEATKAMFDLTGELVELLARSPAKLVDEPDPWAGVDEHLAEPDEPGDAC